VSPILIWGVESFFGGLSCDGSVFLGPCDSGHSAHCLSSDSYNHICRNVWEFWFTRKFFLPDITTYERNWTTWKCCAVGKKHFYQCCL